MIAQHRQPARPLPIRLGEPIFVWLVGFESAETYDIYRARMSADQEWQGRTWPAMREQLIREPEVLRLTPTSRSRLRRLAAMSSMTLYSGPLSMYGAKVQTAGLEKGMPVAPVMVSFTADHRYAPKHPEVLRVKPKRSR